MNKKQKWTDEEINKLIELVEKNESIERIAELLGRTKMAITNRKRREFNRDYLTAEEKIFINTMERFKTVETLSKELRVSENAITKYLKLIKEADGAKSEVLKICSECGETKSEDDYYFYDKHKTHRRNQCKKCFNTIRDSKRKNDNIKKMEKDKKWEEKQWKKSLDK